MSRATRKLSPFSRIVIGLFGGDVVLVAAIFMYHLHRTAREIALGHLAVVVVFDVAFLIFVRRHVVRPMCDTERM